jgi:hypothetical protein
MRSQAGNEKQEGLPDDARQAHTAPRMNTPRSAVAKGRRRRCLFAGIFRISPAAMFALPMQWQSASDSMKEACRAPLELG